MYTFLYMDQKQLTDYFKKFTCVYAVYLFGSHARNDANSFSDIDLAILFADNTPGKFDLRLQFADALRTILRKEIDICDIERSELLFAYRIISEGNLIYTSNEDRRILFEVKLMNKYFDLKAFYEEYYKNIEKLAKGGNIDARPFTY